MKITKEGGKTKINKKIKDKKRNNPNSFGCNNSSIANTSRNKHKLNIR